MAENTAIEWCDHTASPWHGCSEVHAGCDHCYAREMSKRNPKTLGTWGADGVRVKSKSFIKSLEHFNKIGEKSGVMQKVFPSLCDPFEDKPEVEPWRAEMFEAIDSLPWVTLILLTKRPQNVRGMWPRYTYDACATGDCPHDRQSECRVELYRENVWLLTSISDQQSADAMIPPLLECRDLVPVLGVSAEPLVGPIDLEPYIMTYVTDGGDVGYMARPRKPFIDWLICGGESGHHARPMHPAWARSLRDQCQAAGVAFFHKQWGEWYPIHGTGRPSRDEDSEQFPFCWVSRDCGVSQSGCEPDALMLKIGKKAAGRTLDGRTWDEFPQVAGVRHA